VLAYGREENRRLARGQLNGRDKAAVGGHVAVGHARWIERKAGIAVAVKENEAAVGVGAFGEEMSWLFPAIGSVLICGYSFPQKANVTAPSKKRNETA
jgi:hypothetical protein